jgi:nitrogen fixation protein FixH
MTVGLKLEPNKVGNNRAVIVLTANGQKISSARRVTVYLRSLDMDMGLSTVQAKPTSDGNYEADVVLSMGGKWLISVEVSPPQGDTFVTEFRISSSL